MQRGAKLVSAVLASAGIVVALGVAGCTKAKDPWDSVEGGKVKVLVSFAPLYSFAKGVAGKDAKVETLLDATGPHEHQFGQNDAHLAKGANLFLVNGLMLDDHFADNVAKTSSNKSLKVVKVAEAALPEAKRLRMDEAGHDHANLPGADKTKDHDHGTGKDDHPAGKDHDHGTAKKDEQVKGKAHEHVHDHEHGEWDPHAWLGIEQAILMVQTIRDELKAADAANAANYDSRAAEYIDKLKKLQDDGKNLLKDKKNRKLIAQHESLRYFCKSFDLELVDSIMPRPGVEADGKKLADLVEICKKEHVHILAIEPQYPKDRAQTLVDSLRAKGHEVDIVVIDPMETCPREELDADTYFKVMRRNLENLAKQMK